MSRCSPYRPFGYFGSERHSQAIESIKLQKERELAKKALKREKKERKKNEKEKSMSNLFRAKKIHKKISNGLKGGPVQKLLQMEIEQFERSGPTEEHAQLVDEQKISTSSESTQNSKRKREASPPEVVKHQNNSSRSNGNVIRIRLPPRHQSLVNTQEPAMTFLQLGKQSSSGKTLPSQSQTCSTDIVPKLQKQTLVSKHESCSTTSARALPLKMETSVSRQESSSTSHTRMELPLRKQIALISQQKVCSTLGRSLPSQKQISVSRHAPCSTTPAITESPLPKKSAIFCGQGLGPTSRMTKLATNNNNMTRFCPTRPETDIVCSTLGRSLPSQKQISVSRHAPCSTTPAITESPLPKKSAIFCGQGLGPTSRMTKLATNNNNVTRFCPTRPETDIVCSAPRPEIVCSALVPKSVTRKDNATVVSQFSEGLHPSRPRPEIASVQKSTEKEEDNAIVLSQLPEGLHPPRPDNKVKSVIREDNIVAQHCKSLDKKLMKVGLQHVGWSTSVARYNNIIVRNSKSFDKKLVKADLQYKNLFVDWMPSSTQMVLEYDDQDWLVRKNNPDNQSAKKLKPSNNLSCGSNFSLCPRAQFIPEADIYALPYTVPF